MRFCEIYPSAFTPLPDGEQLSRLNEFIASFNALSALDEPFYGVDRSLFGTERAALLVDPDDEVETMLKSAVLAMVARHDVLLFADYQHEYASVRLNRLHPFEFDDVFFCGGETCCLVEPGYTQGIVWIGWQRPPPFFLFGTAFLFELPFELSSLCVYLPRR